MPTPSRPAVNQSKSGYLLPEMALPMSMTGMTLQAEFFGTKPVAQKDSLTLGKDLGGEGDKLERLVLEPRGENV